MTKFCMNYFFDGLYENPNFFLFQVFQVELEYSLAFSLLIYRLDTTISDNNSQRTQCIGKFHRNVNF